MSLQELIRDLVADLNHLYLVTPPPQDAPIKKMIDHLVIVSQHSLGVTLQQDAAALTQANQALVSAKADIAAATTDIKKVSAAIQTAANVVRLIDKAAGMVAPLLI
jgi:maltoporin